MYIADFDESDRNLIEIFEQLYVHLIYTAVLIFAKKKGKRICKESRRTLLEEFCTRLNTEKVVFCTENIKSLQQ